MGHDFVQSILKESRVGISDLTVTAVAAMNPVDEEEWFQAIYVLTLTDKKRIKIKTEKIHWRAGDHRETMNKGRTAIHGKVKEWGISLTHQSCSTFMESDWP